jgi:hypothetical protein
MKSALMRPNRESGHCGSWRLKPAGEMRLKTYLLNGRLGMEAGIRHVTGGQEATEWISYCLCQLD